MKKMPFLVTLLFILFVIALAQLVKADVLFQLSADDFDEITFSALTFTFDANTTEYWETLTFSTTVNIVYEILNISIDTPANLDIAVENIGFGDTITNTAYGLDYKTVGATTLQLYVALRDTITPSTVIITPTIIVASRAGLVEAVAPIVLSEGIITTIGGVKYLKNVWIYIPAAVWPSDAYMFGISYTFLNTTGAIDANPLFFAVYSVAGAPLYNITVTKENNSYFYIAQNPEGGYIVVDNSVYSFTTSNYLILTQIYVDPHAAVRTLSLENTYTALLENTQVVQNALVKTLIINTKTLYFLDMYKTAQPTYVEVFVYDSNNYVLDPIYVTTNVASYSNPSAARLVVRYNDLDQIFDIQHLSDTELIGVYDAGAQVIQATILVDNVDVAGVVVRDLHDAVIAAVASNTATALLQPGKVYRISVILNNGEKYVFLKSATTYIPVVIKKTTLAYHKYFKARYSSGIAITFLDNYKDVTSLTLVFNYFYMTFLVSQMTTVEAVQTTITKHFYYYPEDVLFASYAKDAVDYIFVTAYADANTTTYTFEDYIYIPKAEPDDVYNFPIALVTIVFVAAAMFGFITERISISLIIAAAIIKTAQVAGLIHSYEAINYIFVALLAFAFLAFALERR